MGICGGKDTQNSVHPQRGIIIENPIIHQSNDFIKQEKKQDQELSPNDSTKLELQTVQIQKRRQYIKGEMLSSGSYGEVYVGLDITTKQLIAIKTIKLSGNREKIEQEVMSLKQEIKLAKSFQHTNIVQYKYTEIHEDNKGVDIVLEYVSGGSLRQLLNKIGCLDENIVKKYTKQILQGLYYLHKNGVVHRDIKCANILIDYNQTIKLTDFGTSKRISQMDKTNIQENKSLKGSPYWMSPELINHRSDSTKVDIWALGGCIIEMLSGQPPYSDEYKELVPVMLAIAQGKLPRYPTGISSQARQFLDQTYQIDPQSRPNAEQLLKSNFLNDDFSSDANHILQEKIEDYYRNGLKYNGFQINNLKKQVIMREDNQKNSILSAQNNTTQQKTTEQVTLQNKDQKSLLYEEIPIRSTYAQKQKEDYDKTKMLEAEQKQRKQREWEQALQQEKALRYQQIKN